MRFTSTLVCFGACFVAMLGVFAERPESDHGLSDLDLDSTADLQEAVTVQKEAASAQQAMHPSRVVQGQHALANQHAMLLERFQAVQQARVAQSSNSSIKASIGPIKKRECTGPKPPPKDWLKMEDLDALDGQLGEIYSNAQVVNNDVLPGIVWLREQFQSVRLQLLFEASSEADFLSKFQQSQVRSMMQYQYKPVYVKDKNNKDLALTLSDTSAYALSPKPSPDDYPIKVFHKQKELSDLNWIAVGHRTLDISAAIAGVTPAASAVPALKTMSSILKMADCEHKSRDLDDVVAELKDAVDKAVLKVKEFSYGEVVVQAVADGRHYNTMADTLIATLEDADVSCTDGAVTNSELMISLLVSHLMSLDSEADRVQTGLLARVEQLASKPQILGLSSKIGNDEDLDDQMRMMTIGERMLQAWKNIYHTRIELLGDMQAALAGQNVVHCSIMALPVKELVEIQLPKSFRWYQDATAAWRATVQSQYEKGFAYIQPKLRGGGGLFGISFNMRKDYTTKFKAYVPRLADLGLYADEPMSGLAEQIRDLVIGTACETKYDDAEVLAKNMAMCSTLTEVPENLVLFEAYGTTKNEILRICKRFEDEGQWDRTSAFHKGQDAGALEEVSLQACFREGYRIASRFVESPSKDLQPCSTRDRPKGCVPACQSKEVYMEPTTGIGHCGYQTGTFSAAEQVYDNLNYAGRMFSKGLKIT